MLTSEQSAAVRSPAARRVLVAGAGAGKTSTFAAALVQQLKDEPDERVLAVTFTRAAAREMEHRVRRLVDRPVGDINPDGPQPWIGTLHAWAWSQIEANPERFSRLPGVSLWDDGDVEDAIRLIARGIGAKALKVKDVAVARLSTLKARPEVMAELSALIVEANAFTFDGIESAVAGAYERDPEAVPPYRLVMVDEAQDLSPGQARLLDLFTGKRFRVGDPRQAIYGFRGSDPSIMRGWLGDTEWEPLHLTSNFRSRGAVVAVANTLADAMTGGWRHMVATREDGAVHAWGTPLQGLAVGALVKASLAEGRRPRDIYVIAPTWTEIREAAEVLRAEGVPVAVGKEANPWTELAGRFVRRVLACLNNRHDDVLWALVAAALLRGDTPWTLRTEARRARRPLSALLAEQHPWARALHEVKGFHNAGAVVRRVLDLAPGPAVAHLLPVLDTLTAADALRELALYQQIETPAEDADEVRLGTIHGAKGLEAPVVIVLGVTASRFPAGATPEAEEALRLLYVAVTRAADELHLVSPSASKGFAGWEPEKPSPHLDTMGLTLAPAPMLVWGAP
jgi:DNA helicase-2/ATP-dependent DNA helicase PcrA